MIPGPVTVPRMMPALSRVASMPTVVFPTVTATSVACSTSDASDQYSGWKSPANVSKPTR